MSFPVGKTVIRLRCPHHGELGAFDSTSEAQGAAHDHFAKRHTDREGLTAPLATVEAYEATQLKPSDVEQSAAPAHT
jgi:hypothetical protein